MPRLRDLIQAPQNPAPAVPQQRIFADGNGGITVASQKSGDNRSAANNSYSVQSQQPGQQPGQAPAVSTPQTAVQSAHDIVFGGAEEAPSALSQAQAAYQQAETDYNAAQEALKNTLQNTPSDIDFDSDINVQNAREAARAAEANLRAARQAYEDAGGMGHSYSFEDRASDTVKGALGSSSASFMDAFRALWEKGSAGRGEQDRENYAKLDLAARRAQTNYYRALQEAGGNAEDPGVVEAKRRYDEARAFADRYKGATEKDQGLSAKAQDLADRTAATSAQNISRAKEGLGKAGQLLVDVGVSGTQLAADAAISAMTGIPATALVGARAFGGGTMQARQGGGDINQQLAYGAASATVEMLTEKMADGVAGVFGKGAADDVAESVIRKLAQTDAGRTALRTIYGMAGEGAEEFVSSAVDPTLRSIYNGQTAKQNYSEEDISDWLYDALVGAALGLPGSAGAIVTGQNAAKNTELRMQDASFGDVGSQVGNALDVLQGRISPEQQAAREANARRELGLERPASTGIPALDVIQTGQVQSEAPAPAPAVPAQTAPAAPTPAAPAPVSEAPATAPAAPAPAPATTGIPVLDVIQNGEVQSEAAAPAVETAAPAAVEAEAPAASLDNQLTDVQNRLAEINAELDSLDGLDGAEVDDAHISELVEEGQRLWEEERRLTGQIEARNIQQARVEAGEVSKAFGTPENHIDNRNFSDVANQSTKAFQFDHPELHEHFVNAAQELMREVEAADMQTDVRAGQKGSAVKRGPVRYLMDNGMSKPRIMQCLSDIINNNGAENYADAKRVELVLNDMMTNGWTGLDRSAHDPNPDYIAAKDAIGGGVKADSWEKYLEDNSLPLALGEVTEEQLRAEWEAQHPEAAQPAQPELTAPATAETAGSEPETNLPPASTPEQASSATPPGNGPFSAPAGLNTGTEAREGRFSSNTLANNENAANVPEDQRSRFTYETKSEGQSVAEAAARLATDRSGEVQKLTEAEAWSGAQTDMAAQIANELYEAGDLEAYSQWKKVMNDHAIETGRGTQAWAKYNRQDGQSAFEAVTDAVNENDSLTAEQKSNILKNAKEASDKYDAALRDVAEAKNAAMESGGKAKAPESLLDLIRETSKKRNTGTLFSKNLDKLLNAQSGNVDYLTQLAYNQIVSMSNDYTTQKTFAEKVKSVQTLMQLSSIATFGRNIAGNFSFGAVDTLAKDGFGVALDRMLSKATGKRTVAFDKSWFSSDARKGGIDALQKSMLEVALDVDMEGGESANRYGQATGRTFKMTGNAFERFMSRWEQLLSYSLTSSDKLSRGALEAENARGLNALQNNGLTAEEMSDIAQQEADYRLFQNKDQAYKLSKGIHDVANLVGFGGQVNGVTRSGGFGLGDIINTYPGVPANLGVKPLEYSPANIVKGGIELVKVLSDAKNGKLNAASQYKAVMDISRGLAGVPIVALFAAMFKAGAIKNWDDEDDKDAKALNASEGKQGIQFNLSAANRWLHGESPEWQNGDTVDSVGYLEPLNAFMGIGSLVASQEEDATISDYAKSYANGAIQSFLDIPVMSNLANLVDTYQYSAGETDAEKLGEAALAYAASSLTGFAPAPLRGTAKALDPYYRDTSGENVLDSAKNAFVATVPGLRETLPVKLDNFGNPKMYSGDTGERLLNTLVNPGDRTTIRESPAGAFVEELRTSSGDAAVIPDRRAPNRLDFGDGNGNTELTPEEKQVYQSAYGSAAERYVLEMMDDELFNSLDPNEQAAVIKELYGIAKQDAKRAVADSRSIELAPSDYDKLLAGQYDANGDEKRPPLQEQNVGEYIAFNTTLNAAKKDNDFEALGALFNNFEGLDKNTQAVLAAKDPYARLVLGTDKPGTSGDIPKLNPENVSQYAEFTTGLKDATAGGDYRAIDDLLSNYGELDPNTQAVLQKKNPNNLKNVLSFISAGSSAESFYKVKDAVDDAHWDMDTNGVNAHVKLAGLASTDIPDAEKDKLIQSGAFALSSTATSVYDVLRGHGMKPGDISSFFEGADWYASGSGKEAKADGKLNAYEVATAISKLSGLNERQRAELFSQFRQALRNPNDPYDTWKKKTYYAALNQSTYYGRTTGK